MREKFKLVDYKGQYYIIQDELFEMDFESGAITREAATEKSFVKLHKETCNYYGIPCYIGNDKELKELFK